MTPQPEQPQTAAGRGLADEPDAGYDRHARTAAVLAIEAEARAAGAIEVERLRDRVRALPEVIEALVGYSVVSRTDVLRVIDDAATPAQGQPSAEPLDVVKMAEAIHATNIAYCRRECRDPEFGTFSAGDHDLATILIREYERRLARLESGTAVPIVQQLIDRFSPAAGDRT